MPLVLHTISRTQSFTSSCSGLIPIGWDDIDPQSLLDEHPVLYTSADPDDREPVDNVNIIMDTPMHDEAGYPIHFFKEDGTPVRRSNPDVSILNNQSGILMNLTTAHEMFPSVDDALSFDDDITSEPLKIRNFPQAFCSSYGHLQSNIAPTAILHCTNTLNEQLGVEDGMDPIVIAHNFQGYNLTAHTLSTHAGAQEVERAWVTSCMAGQHSTTDRNKRRFNKAFDACSTSFAHERMEQRLSAWDCPCAFRAEQVYTINILDLHDEDRTGESVAFVVSLKHSLNSYPINPLVTFTVTSFVLWPSSSDAQKSQTHSFRISFSFRRRYVWCGLVHVSNHRDCNLT